MLILIGVLFLVVAGAAIVTVIVLVQVKKQKKIDNSIVGWVVMANDEVYRKFTGSSADFPAPAWTQAFPAGPFAIGEFVFGKGRVGNPDDNLNRVSPQARPPWRCTAPWRNQRKCPGWIPRQRTSQRL